MLMLMLELLRVDDGGGNSAIDGYLIQFIQVGRVSNVCDCMNVSCFCKLSQMPLHLAPPPALFIVLASASSKRLYTSYFSSNHDQTDYHIPILPISSFAVGNMKQTSVAMHIQNPNSLE